MVNKTYITQIILNALEFSGPGNQHINELRKKYLQSGVVAYCKDLPKVAPGSDYNLVRTKLEDLMKLQLATFKICERLSNENIKKI